MMEHIELEMKGAAVKEILDLGCGLDPRCRAKITGALHLAYTDGRHNTYYGCETHLRELEARHPRIGPRAKQTFFYA